MQHATVNRPQFLLGTETGRFFEGRQHGPPRVVNEAPAWAAEAFTSAPLPAELFEPFVNVGPVQ